MSVFQDECAPALSLSASSSTCDGVSSTAKGSQARRVRTHPRTRTEPHHAEAHDLFLGKTVEGVLDLIAARSGRKLSSPFVYNWAFATAQCLHARAAAGARACARWRKNCCVTRPCAGRGLAIPARARALSRSKSRGLADLFGEHLYVTSMVARPKPAPDVYLLAASRLGVRPEDAWWWKIRPRAPRRPLPPACAPLVMHLRVRLTPCAPAAQW
jgi:hypothetical protein